MADYFLMYTNSTSTTGRELANKLREAGLDLADGREVDRRYQGVVRWGATARMSHRPGKIVNPGTAIQKAADKWEFMNEMREAGIRIPDTWGPASPGIQFPCLGRKREHVGGNDIVLCLQRADLAIATGAPDQGGFGCEFFSQYIPTADEYRLHVYGERVIKTSKKVRTPNEDGRFAPFQAWVRNFGAGYTFRQPEERVPATTKYMAIQAVELAGLDFGAVDIIVSDEGRPYVLEVNTAPGLHTDSGFDAYTRRIVEEFA